MHSAPCQMPFRCCFTGSFSEHSRTIHGYRPHLTDGALSSMVTEGGMGVELNLAIVRPLLVII